MINVIRYKLGCHDTLRSNIDAFRTLQTIPTHFPYNQARILNAGFTGNIELCINDERNATHWYARQTMYRRSETAFNRYN